MCKEGFLSIVTPVYNREKLIERSFQSLCSQTCKQFEWIVIDDGSQDRSLEVVKSFEGDFPIKVISKTNGGKHTALNASHPLIKGDYVLILDSDDYLIPTAVEDVLRGWNKYNNNDDIGIVIFLKGDSVNHPSCMAFPEDEGKSVDIMSYQRQINYSLDACEIIRTELFVKYPFPVFEGEKFISEGALWNRVSFTHKCVYINKVIYIADYLEGGLTKSGRHLRIHNPKGGMYTANLNMNSKNLFKRRIKNGILYTCYGFFSEESLINVLKGTDSKAIAAVCIPAGYLLYLLWKHKYY